ncbi:hypothetical protein CPC08DRAFT_783784 [Agrocybe pediades]|nr:hypothetical protein CPC08DRAFT_783784 [Agrocybe pediades]
MTPKNSSSSSIRQSHRRARTPPTGHTTAAGASNTPAEGSNTESHKGKRRKLNSGGDDISTSEPSPHPSNPSTFAQHGVANAIQPWLDEIRKHSFSSDFEEADILEDVEKALESAIKRSHKRRRKIKDMSKSPEWPDFKVLSFSKVQQGDLQRLGLETEHQPLDIDNTLLESLRNLVIPQEHKVTVASLVKEYEESGIFAHVVRELRFFHMGAGHKHETAARLIIDKVLISILEFAWKKGIHEFLFTEMQISGQSDEVEVHHECFKTFLTGRVDYLATAVATYLSDDLQRRALTSNNLTALMKLEKAWPGLTDSTGPMKCTVTEAKSRDANLMACTPQVCAESQAILIKTSLFDMQEQGSAVVPD